MSALHILLTVRLLEFMSCGAVSGDPDVQPLKLLAWPSKLAVRAGQAIVIRVALENKTEKPISTRLSFLLSQPRDYRRWTRCLRGTCTELKSGKVMPFYLPPVGATPDDFHHREGVRWIGSHQDSGANVNLADCFFLAPGSYRIELEYDTQIVPPWIKPSKDAWHGITNKARVELQVFR
jgi:hypothetical protein